jgi:hypothetical protein
MCPKKIAAVVHQFKSNKVDKGKHTIERANSSKSKKLQEQAKKNVEMQKKKAEQEIKKTQMKTA